MLHAADSLAPRVARCSIGGDARVRQARAVLPASTSTVVLTVLFTVLFTVLTVLSSVPSVAHAHADVETSSPAAGEIVDEPVDTVVITFSAAVTPIGDRFVALDATGVRRAPVDVEVVDDRVFTLRFDPPLAGGEIGMRWEIAALDTHSKSGTFAFEVTAALPTAATAGGEIAGGRDVALDVTAGGSTTTLDEFLTVAPSRPGATTALIGRMITLPAVVVAIGALAFAAAAFRGSASDLRFVLGIARLSGAALVVGALLDYVGVVRLLERSAFGGIASGAGTAALLRVLGGAALVVGVSRVFAAGAIERPGTLSSAVVDRSAVRGARTRGPSDTARSGLASGPRSATASSSATGAARWRLDGRSAVVGVAVTAIVSSFWFDGHTASKGNRVLHAVVDSVHVVAGGVWAGGVLTMAALCWTRRRHARPAALATTIVRFSGLATVSLAAVVGAGLVMAVLVLDSLGDLTSTEWGRILVLKSTAVAIVAAVGGFNHVVLVPVIERDPQHAPTLERIRTTLAVEAILLTFVVLVTAWLVAAAS